MTHLTRRQTTRLIAASIVAPNVALAQKKKKKKRKGKRYVERTPEFPELMAALERALNKRLVPDCGGKFTVAWLESNNRPGNEVMRATVRLDWTPGWRQRAFRGTGTDQNEALQDIFNASLATFAKTWPECVRA